MSAGFPNDPQTPRPLRTVIAGDDDREKQLARLRPLINQLIAHDLVGRSPSGTFQLRDDVQAHLELLAERRARTVAQVYIGRTCPSCGAMVATTLRDGVRQCDGCRTSRHDGALPLVAGAQPRVDRHRSRPRWNRWAS